MSGQKKCFIIQPLSEEYKERCKDAYKPAIEEAGLSPYRVDENYDAIKLRIQTIQEEIKKAVVCLADITEDNANVWYEVGFADGHNIPVVFICNKDKRETLPFDVNQRSVYYYTRGSSGNWKELQEEIANMLTIAVEQTNSTSKGGSVEPSSERSSDKFKDAELFILWALHYGVEKDRHWVSEQILKKRMEEWFCHEDIIDAFARLKSEEIIIPISTLMDDSSEYELSEKGINWCLENQHLVREAGKRCKINP